MNNYKLLIKIILIVFMVIFTYKFVEIRSEGISLVDTIEESYSKSKKINLSEYNIYIDKISDIKITNNILPEEILAIALNKYIDGDIETDEYFKLCVDSLDKRDDFKLKYIALKIIIKKYTSEGNSLEVERYIKKIAELFTFQEYQLNYTKIRELLHLVFDVEDCIDSSVETLEKILVNEKYFSPDAKSMYVNLLGVYYNSMGQYSKAIVQYLKAGDIKGNEISEYYAVKSKIDLGNIFSAFDEYSIAEEVFREAIDMKINNEEYESSMKMYSYANLLESLVYQEKYDEFFIYLDEIKKYYDKADKDIADSINIFVELFTAKVYIETNRIDEAIKLFTEIKKLKEDYGDSIFIDGDIYYYVIEGDLLSAQNKYDEALEVYNYVYTMKKERMNIKYEREVIRRIIDLYDKIENCDMKAIYAVKLVDLNEENSAIVNKEYTSYVINKYNDDKDLEIYMRKKLIMTSIRIIVISIILIALIIIYIKLNRVKKLNNIDGLTGIYNRKFFNERFNYKFSKRFSLVILDIDNFKSINDTYGHAFGDEVIQGIAQILKDTIGKQGEVFRYGGEEFAVILDTDKIEAVKECTECIRSGVESKEWSNDTTITVSIGVSLKEFTKEKTFEVADNNLYISKNNGKNRVTV